MHPRLSHAAINKTASHAANIRERAEVAVE
jgi:hypothetical protein